ncbi:hypothetical protein PENFLA_c013G01213 [Penicillium flavigenum]|uniref:Uncharacterized protein n=1 Tax=Penicillium flavigenum TaxID=254877 RepID=A0A1V6T8F4_9EURO|nr:hypothetical protein PENFLA_c013G01213 [Penicillium flavigenum]
MSGYVEGAVVKVNQPATGIYYATQISDAEATASSLKSVVPQPEARINFGPISFFGVLTVSGYVDTGTYEASISVAVLGISLGTLTGSLKTGISVQVNLIAVKGEIRFYLKNSNELWVHFDLSVIFDGHYTDDVKIITL